MSTTDFFTREEDTDDARSFVGQAPAQVGLLRRLLARRSAAVALVVFLVLVALVLIAPVLPISDPNEQSLRDRLTGPSGAHWLGTDALGRDTFARLIHGGRVSLSGSLQALVIAVGIGVPVGLLAGHLGGWFDAVSSRLVDALLALPPLVLAVAVVGALGPGLTNAMIAIGAIMMPTFFRVSRSVSAQLRHEIFVDAARTIGCSRRRMLVSYLLPNAMSPIVVQLTFAAGVAITAEAGLSFLGLGVRPPQASWGTMTREAFDKVGENVFQVVPPSLAIVVATLCLIILGDALRDELARDGDR